MNSIEDYQNLVKLLRYALSYYADENIYSDNSPLAISVMIDMGSQARFALNKIKEFEDLNENFEKEFEAHIKNIEEGSESDVIKKWEVLKLLNNRDYK
jgi:hypothetical protein